MADKSRDSFQGVSSKSLEQRLKALSPDQRYAYEQMCRKQNNELRRLKTEHAQQREAAEQEAFRKRLSQKTTRHYTPGHTSPSYRSAKEEAERQAIQNVAGREAQQISYLEQRHAQEREQTLKTMERDNQREPAKREQFRQNARDITRRRRDRNDGWDRER